MTPTDPPRCEPPPELRGVDGWHWVQDRTGDPVVRRWLAGPYPAWRHLSMPSTAELAYQAGYRYVAPVTPPAVVAALVEALEECAGDLEAEIVATYAGIDRYPSEMRKKDRDMAPVRAARAALALYRGRP